MGEASKAGAKYTTCVFCDGGCALKVEGCGEDAKVAPADPAMPAICSKAFKVDEYRLHPARVTKPLKNTGQRDEPVWQEVLWDEALDDITARLQVIIHEHGPEAVAFCENPLNHGFGGITRRLANCIGTPNYTAPQELCMGNTAQVHRAVYGWYTASAWDKTDCIVYFGQNRNEENWPKEYLALKAALARGAKLVVIDPRRTPIAEFADCHLPICYGSDAALALAMVNVIIEEGLYDREFVDARCIGFEELCARVAEHTPERAAVTCGIDAEDICIAARLYAGAEAAIIPWGVVPDMQINSTSLIQAQCILRAICGFLNKSETVFGPPVGGITNAELSAFELLSEEQRAKQLGRDTHPLLTFATAELYREPLARFGIGHECDILAESCACDPPALFAAMRGEGPYPVKATFAIANNTVMSYAGQQGIVDAFMGQDLVVSFEHWLTPTAQLSDYVLPGDMWAERDVLGPQFDMAPLFKTGRAFCEPVGECRGWYSVVKDLADRLGYAEQFPWASERELYDWRLAPLGLSWEQACEKAPAPVMTRPVALGSFVTPSGKVELKSAVLEMLGFDGLPSYREPFDPLGSEGSYPYIIFSGLRDRKSYNTNLHQIESLRRLEPEPLLFINPADAAAEGISEGDWCMVETGYGSIELLAHLDCVQPPATLRVPHGWWKPETAQGLAAGLSGAMFMNDGMLFPDEEWNLDPIQGLPNLRGGIHARVEKR